MDQYWHVMARRLISFIQGKTASEEEAVEVLKLPVANLLVFIGDADPALSPCGPMALSAIQLVALDTLDAERASSAAVVQ